MMEISKNHQNKSINGQYNIFGVQNRQNDDKSSNMAAVCTITISLPMWDFTVSV